MKFKANVTSEAITIAQRNNKAHCAIATAIAHQYPNARFITVDRDQIAFTDVATRTRYKFRTPRNAQVFIDKFDAGYSLGDDDQFSLNVGDADVIDIRSMRARAPKQVAQPRPKPKNPGTGTPTNERKKHADPDAA